MLNNECDILVDENDATIGSNRSGEKFGRIIMVGDDKQAIYGFRGAFSGVLDMMKTFLNAGELTLPGTYRCGKNIVAEVQHLVPDYFAFEENHDGAVIPMQYEEIFKDFTPGVAVLSRKNAPLIPGCLRCLRMGMKARVEGKDIGKNLISLVEQIAGKKTQDLGEFLNKLQNWQSKQIEIITAANSRNKERRIEEVCDKVDTIEILAQDMFTVAELTNRIAFLFTDSADVDSTQYVTFSSVHKAKGLEWDKVFVLNETFYPGGKKSEEEDNLVYVAKTRAKNILVNVHGLNKDREEI